MEKQVKVEVESLEVTVRTPDERVLAAAEDAYQTEYQRAVRAGAPTTDEVKDILHEQGWDEAVHGRLWDELNDKHGRLVAALALDNLPADEGELVAEQAAENRAEVRALTEPWYRAHARSAESRAERARDAAIAYGTTLYADTGLPLYTGTNDPRIDGPLGLKVARTLALLSMDLPPDHDDQQPERLYLTSIGLPADAAG